MSVFPLASGTNRAMVLARSVSCLERLDLKIDIVGLLTAQALAQHACSLRAGSLVVVKKTKAPMAVLGHHCQRLVAFLLKQARAQQSLFKRDLACTARLRAVGSDVTGNVTEEKGVRQPCHGLDRATQGPRQRYASVSIAELVP